MWGKRLAAMPNNHRCTQAGWEFGSSWQQRRLLNNYKGQAEAKARHKCGNGTNHTNARDNQRKTHSQGKAPRGRLVVFVAGASANLDRFRLGPTSKKYVPISAEFGQDWADIGQA